MLDMFIRTGQAQAEHLKERYDCCDVLLRCDKLPGDAYFGIVSGNFTSFDGEEMPWDSKQVIALLRSHALFLARPLSLSPSLPLSPSLTGSFSYRGTTPNR